MLTTNLFPFLCHRHYCSNQSQSLPNSVCPTGRDFCDLLQLIPVSARHMTEVSKYPALTYLYISVTCTIVYNLLIYLFVDFSEGDILFIAIPTSRMRQFCSYPSSSKFMFLLYRRVLKEIFRLLVNGT